MDKKTRRLQRLQIRIDRLEYLITVESTQEGINKRTIQRNRILQEKAKVEAS